MASTDKVTLRAARQSAFLTEAAPWVNTKTGITVTLSGGEVTFGGLTGMPAPPSGRPLAGDTLHVSGLEGANAVWNGIYEVKTSTVALDTDVICYAPAGKNALSDVTSTSETVTLGTLVPLRMTGEDLKGNLEKRESEEITGSRGVADLIRNGVTASGSISAELSLPAWTPLIQSGLMESWTHNGASSVCVDSATVTCPSSSRMSIADSEGSFANVVAGDWVKVTGSNYNDGVYRVTDVDNTGDPNTLDIDCGTLNTAEDSTTVSIHIGDSLTEGSTLFPSTIERVYADITGGDVHYPRFIGKLIQSMAFSSSAQGPITLATQWLGSREYGTGAGESGTPTTAIGTPAARPPGQVLEGASDVSVWIDGATGGCVNQFDMTIANALESRLCLGTEGATDMIVQGFSATGSFSRYYATRTLYDYYMSSTDLNLAIPFVSPGGPAVVFDYPRVELSDANRGTPGRNQTLFLNADFIAKESADGYTVKVWRWEA